MYVVNHTACVTQKCTDHHDPSSGTKYIFLLPSSRNPSNSNQRMHFRFLLGLLRMTSPCAAATHFAGTPAVEGSHAVRSDKRPVRPIAAIKRHMNSSWFSEDRGRILFGASENEPLTCPSSNARITASSSRTLPSAVLTMTLPLFIAQICFSPTSFTVSFRCR